MDESSSDQRFPCSPSRRPNRPASAVLRRRLHAVVSYSRRPFQGAHQNLFFSVPGSIRISMEPRVALLPIPPIIPQAQDWIQVHSQIDAVADAQATGARARVLRGIKQPARLTGPMQGPFGSAFHTPVQPFQQSFPVRIAHHLLIDIITFMEMSNPVVQGRSFLLIKS